MQPLEGLFELTPAVTRQLRLNRRHRADIVIREAPIPLPEDTIRLDLPRWDLAWVVKTRRGGWPKIDPKTGKVLKHRPVWEALRGNARNAHYAQRHKATKAVIAAVVTAATRAGLQPCQHLMVQLVWAPGDGRKADVDNLVHLQKVCCDALARGRSDLPGLRLVPDDTDRWMTKLMPRIDRPPVPSGLWLEIAAR